MADGIRAAEAAVGEATESSAAQSFEQFFRMHHARLYATLCLTSGDAAEAEEIMQEAFTRVWERWKRISGHPDPDGYLYRTAFNILRDRKRRALLAARRVLHLRPEEDVFGRIDERQTIREALRRLTPRQRAALVLTDYLDLTSEKAAELLGVKPATARSLASQARTALRSSLEEFE